MQLQAALVSSLVQHAANITAREAQISRELSTGSRIGSLSDDPAAASASVRLSSQIAQTTAATSAIQAVQSRMQTADSALAEVVSRLTSAVSTVVSGATDTVNASNRSAMANQLASIRSSIITLANSSYGGSYLFAGTQVQTAPFATDASTGAVSYAGDANTPTLIANGLSVPTVASGSAVFGSGASSVFGALQGAIDTLGSGAAPTTEQVASLRSALQTVIDQRSVLAAGAARLEEQRTYTATERTNLQADQSEAVASDPVALATELTAAQTQRSALLSSLAVLGKGSLFDYL